MSLVDDIVTSSALLAPIEEVQTYRKPSAAEVLERVQEGLLPHQVAFCEDTEHCKLGMV